MIFARKDKHFRAFEAAMRQPRPPAPADRNAPALWERARELFTALMDQAFSLARLATRPRMTRSARHEILKRLIPVEKLTRFLLTIEAVTFLLMTPEGARLRRDIRPAPPQPAPPPASKAESRRMPAPGWHTIAAAHPRIDPRIAENERRAAEAAALQKEQLEQAGQEDENRLDFGLGAADPASWRCTFHTKVDFSPYTDDVEWTPPPARRSATIELLGDDPSFPRLIPEKPRRKPVAEPPPGADDGLGPHAALARRIEALSRIFANPEAAIRRLARRLAAMSLDDLWPCDPASLADRWWLPHRRDLYNAADMFCGALIAFCRAHALRPPEPG
jgi:hypothetical protein